MSYRRNSSRTGSSLLAAGIAAVLLSAPTESITAADIALDARGDVSLTADRATGTTANVRVSRGGDLYPKFKAGQRPAAKAGAFLREHGAMFGIENPDRQLRLIDERSDGLGFTRISYQQFHRGVPVFGGVLRAHLSPDGRLTAVNGKFIPGIELEVEPRVSTDAVRRTAMDAVRQAQPLRRKHLVLETGAPELMIYRSNLTRGGRGENYLAYQVEISGPGSVREFAYVDALDGKIVDRIDGVMKIKDRRVYEGSYDPTNPELPPPAWREGDPRPALQPAHEDEIAGAGESYNFFFNLSNGTYRSWDGNDAQMITVNNDPTIVCPNANWNGTSTNYCTGTSADDVVTHEWGHAYTQETSGLIYAWQSGALNESYSDIFGETVDLLNNREFIAGAQANPQGDAETKRSSVPNSCSDFDSNFPEDDLSYRWLMGEDAFLFAALPPVGDAAIRDMWHPTCFGDAGHVNSGNYHCAASDAGGVHANSSINNRAYALLVDGDTVDTNDDGSARVPAVTVTGIGLTKAAHIFWRANATYNTPASNFADNADSLEMACSDLIGVNLTKLVTSAEDGTSPVLGHAGENDDTIDPTPELSGEIITAADCDQVSNAIAAVEMRFDVTKMCGFQPMLSPAPAPLCGTAETLTFFSEDWEGGFAAGWSTGQEGVTKATLDTQEWFLRSSLPDNRDGSAHAGSAMFQENRRDLGNCTTDDESGHLWLESPVITVHPSDPSQLMFEHYVNTEVSYDGGNVMISINGGAYSVIPASAFVHNPYNGSLNTAANQNTNPKEGEPAWHGGNQGEVSGDWGQSQIDLAAAGVAPGDQIQLRWDFGQDGCNGNEGWYVDQVQLFSCGGVIDPPTKECTTYPADLLLPSPILFLNDSVTTAQVSGATKPVSDVNVTSLTGFHTYMGDLVFTLESPAGTSITLFDGATCAGDDGIDINFDDDAATIAGCGDWLSGGTFKPHQALAAFNDEDANGTWTLTVTDGDPQDEGFVDGWGVELCTPIELENQPPVAVDDSASTRKDTPIRINVLANDSDPDGDPLTVVSVTQPANGMAFINADSTVTYQPDDKFKGTDSFGYTIEDDHGNSASATVTVSVHKKDDDDFDDDGKSDDEDSDDDNDGKHDDDDSDDDNDGVNDDDDSDDDNDGIDDEFDSESTDDEAQSQSGYAETGTTDKFPVAVHADTLVLIAAVRGPGTQLLDVKIRDAAGALVATSVPTLDGATAVAIPSAAGVYTVEVANTGPPLHYELITVRQQFRP